MQGTTPDKSYFSAKSEGEVRNLLKSNCNSDQVVYEGEEGNQISCHVTCHSAIGHQGMTGATALKVFFTYRQPKELNDMSKPEFKNGPFIYNLFPKK